MEPPQEEWVWPFVHCAVCHHLYQTPRAGQDGVSAQPTLPFWLTECGHVICNNHIRPDRVCTKCGEQDVQATALSHQMGHSMADWFRPLPLALDSVAQAARFQHEMITTLLLAYKSKCIKQRQQLDVLKTENENLRQELEMREHGIPNELHKRARYDQQPQQAQQKRQLPPGTRSSDPAPTAMSAGFHTPVRPNTAMQSAQQFSDPSMQSTELRATSIVPVTTTRAPAPVPFGQSHQPPVRPESRFDQFAFHSPTAPSGGAFTQTASMRVSQTPGGWATHQKQQQQQQQQAPAPRRRPSAQAMPPPQAPPQGSRFRPAASPGPMSSFPGSQVMSNTSASIARMGTPSVSRPSPAPFTTVNGGANRQRFTPIMPNGNAGGAGYRPPAG
ncbi:hypothetical protein BKA62DRAFT_717875 [Auriculariales sp. MPI-PUGE-AT-0066]|nr:hypothetical protein BKA62DRAFT_717875 [Auriculariales sp. MPI-PUGE-AT-0066]